MASIVKSLRVLGDPNRLRMLLLLAGEELSVAELQEILGMGQSTISTHLAQLKHAGLVEDRRTGKNIWYRFNSESGVSELLTLLQQAKEEIPEGKHDQAALQLILRKRQDKTRAFFDDMAGRLGREYVPGRSWQSIAEALLQLLPPLVIADLGAGEGAFSLLLAQRAQQVIAVDNSDKMVELGSALARKQGVTTLEYRKGDLEAVPIADGSVDLALFSQSLHHALHPERAVAEAWRILKDASRSLTCCNIVLPRRASYMPTCGWASAKWIWRACWATPASGTCTQPLCIRRPKHPFFKPCWRREANRLRLKAHRALMAHPFPRCCRRHSPHAVFIFSIAKSFFLRSVPQRYPVSEPSLPITRWQGTAMATGLVAQARATARTAFG
jgi:ubiquinone/menaquinone biosynthesis C-methylase UbiE/DNA-binding transcriptional ArsR family regulator